MVGTRNLSFKKKTILIISGLILAVVVGTITYFTWLKKEDKVETRQQNQEEKVQQLQNQLSQLKNDLDKQENQAKKTEFSTQITEIENKLNNLSGKNQEQEKDIKKLEQEIKEIEEKLENNDKPNDQQNPPPPKNPGDNPPPPNNPDPQPDPQDNIGYKYVATKINDNTYKYHLTLSGTQLSFRDFIAFSKNKKTHFFSAFQGALKDANSKFPAYFWKCPPVSEKTLDKPFEFVVIKSDSLNNMTQDWKKFNEYLAEAVLLEKPAVSFSNPNKDAILVIPKLTKSGNQTLDYKNITQFTKNAPDEQQQELWKEVAEKLSEELAKGDRPRWLSTHGLGVEYLHVRIDERPKYYHFAEYEKWG